MVINKVYVHTKCPSCGYESTVNTIGFCNKSASLEIECCMCGYTIVKVESEDKGTPTITVGESFCKGDNNGNY